MFRALVSVLKYTAIGGILTLLSYLLSLAIFGSTSSSIYRLVLPPAFVAALISFAVCSMVIVFFRQRPTRRRGSTLLEHRTSRLRYVRLELRTKLALCGMIVLQFLFWLFLPKIVCGSRLDDFTMCVGGDDAFVDPVTASLAASLIGIVLGWTVPLWALMILSKLTIGNGDEFMDFLIYNRELHKAVREEGSVHNQDT